MSKVNARHTPSPWIVRPDYSQENVYRIWDQNTNFTDDSGDTDVMDANARLMEAAPKLLKAAEDILAAWNSRKAVNAVALRRAVKEARGE